MPLGMNAPNDWPAEPVRSRPRSVPAGSPFSPWRLVTSWPSIVPTARSVLRIGRSIVTCSPCSSDVARSADQLAGRSACRARASGRRGCVRGSSSANSGPVEDRREVETVGLPVLDRAGRRRAARGGRSPRRASGSRARRGTRAPPAAMNSKKFTTNSGLPLKRARSSGFWVATPTGQVSRWQTRIMMQPETTSGAVAKPNSSAPSSAPMMTSRPVFI